jgi:hypothetical protein
MDDRENGAIIGGSNFTKKGYFPTRNVSEKMVYAMDDGFSCHEKLGLERGHATQDIKIFLKFTNKLIGKGLTELHRTHRRPENAHSRTSYRHACRKTHIAQLGLRHQRRKGYTLVIAELTLEFVPV